MNLNQHKGTITPSQYVMMQPVVIVERGKPVVHPGMNTALCFQPLAKTYDWKKGIALDETGNLLKNKAGQAVMEHDLCKEMRQECKLLAQEQDPENWQKTWYNPILQYRSPR